MKKILLFTAAILVVASCSKEKLDPDDPLVGRVYKNVIDKNIREVEFLSDTLATIRFLTVEGSDTTLEYSFQGGYKYGVTNDTIHVVYRVRTTSTMTFTYAMMEKSFMSQQLADVQWFKYDRIK